MNQSNQSPYLSHLLYGALILDHYLPALIWYPGPGTRQLGTTPIPQSPLANPNPAYSASSVPSIKTIIKAF